MIVYDLECRDWQHRFEGWFKSSDDYSHQQGRGLVSCPQCGSVQVSKAIQAPRLARKGNQIAEPKHPARRPPAVAETPQPSVPGAMTNTSFTPQQMGVMQALVKIQAEALKTSRFVGENFVDDARAMHYGEREAEAIHGQATIDEAKELLEEGIGVMPLPFPVIPPEQAN